MKTISVVRLVLAAALAVALVRVSNAASTETDCQEDVFRGNGVVLGLDLGLGGYVFNVRLAGPQGTDAWYRIAYALDQPLGMATFYTLKRLWLTRQSIRLTRCVDGEIRAFRFGGLDANGL